MIFLTWRARFTQGSFPHEESYGYLSGTYVRDKDAVVASMLICELAAWWKGRGLDLYEAMQLLYDRYGYWANELLSVTYEGPEGFEKMKVIMKGLRSSAPCDVAGIPVQLCFDYSDGAPMPIVNLGQSSVSQELPPSDVFELQLSGGSRVIIRLSGTEPKTKAYVFARGNTLEAANDLLVKLSGSTQLILKS